ncbi:GntR family transcriptional regulator [Aneurinibacillus sp. REN35]|uniref:GntR family transcriptional regulator n=2 Tax=Paenibacillaceae TaxID=186822 RepID=UPI0035281260
MNAYDFIRSAIIEGDYAPGQRLTEEALAAELHISRTPIREALKRLETEGLIVSLKRGVSVKTFSRESIRQIYDLRALLEGYTATQAAINHTTEDIKRLWHIHEAYGQAIERLDEHHPINLKEVVRLNNKFHEGVLLASKNEYMEFLLSKVFVLPLVFRSFYWYNKEEIEQSQGMHQTILEAIEQRDPERSKSAMSEHIYRGRDHVLRHIIEEGGDEEKEDCL